MNSKVKWLVSSLVNMSLRAFTIFFKFALLFFMARVMQPEMVGLYSLVTATVSYALFFLGFDLYTYSQREMLSLEMKDWSGILQKQFSFYLYSFIVALPIMLLLFVFEYIPWSLAPLFFVLLPLEHLSQELYRLLIICNKQTVAMLSYFFRMGAWIPVAIIIYVLIKDYQLNYLLFLWILGDLIAIGIALLTVNKHLGRIVFTVKLDLPWLVNGLKVSSRFLVGTLALRGLFVFDRYFISAALGKEDLGIYGFYFGIANAAMVFADAGVISRLYPKLVSACRNGDKVTTLRLIKGMLLGISGVYMIISIFVYFSINPLLSYIGKTQYVDNLNVFWILYLSMFIFTLGLVPHYVLYANCEDKKIMRLSVFTIVVFISLLNLLNLKSTFGVACNMLISILFLTIIKTLYAKKYLKLL